MDSLSIWVWTSSSCSCRYERVDSRAVLASLGDIHSRFQEIPKCHSLSTGIGHSRIQVISLHWFLVKKLNRVFFFCLPIPRVRALFGSGDFVCDSFPLIYTIRILTAPFETTLEQTWGSLIIGSYFPLLCCEVLIDCFGGMGLCRIHGCLASASTDPVQPDLNFRIP